VSCHGVKLDAEQDAARERCKTPERDAMMLRPVPTRSMITIVVVLWTCVLGLLATANEPTAPRRRQTAVGAPAPRPPAPAAARAIGGAQQQGEFAGTDSCIGCHDSEGKSLAATLHGKAENPRTPAGSGQT